MKTMITWFAKHNVAANLLMITIIIGGLLTYPRIKKEIFPDTVMDMVTISVVYPGASPEDVEKGICIKIEEAIDDVEGIEEITSVSAESMGTVNAEISNGYDTMNIKEKIKTRVDSIDTFPEDAEDPIVNEFVSRNPVINIAIAGNTDERTLKELGRQIRDDLVALPEITQAELTGARPYEITVEVSEESLKKYHLSFDDISMAIKKSSLDLPGGLIKSGGGEIMLRTLGQSYNKKDFDNIPVFANSNGTRILLKDVAKVSDSFTETDKISLFNQVPSVNILVYRTGDQNVMKLANAVKEYVVTKSKLLPPEITLTTWQDWSRMYQDRFDLLRRNGIYGFILVFILLALFLNLRLAFWVSIGIPISFLGAMWILPGLDMSINMLSMFSFILVLGIVVDDAIVVGEGIYSWQKKGLLGKEGAIKGVNEVAVPVIFSVLTTIAAFFPMLNLPGFMGKIWRIIPTVVIATLVFSLIESQLILPTHLAHKQKLNKDNSKSLWTKFQSFFSVGLEKFILNYYKPIILKAIKYRYLTLSIAFGILIITISFIMGNHIKIIFFPNVEADFVSAKLNMVTGTPIEKTKEAVKKIEFAALQLQEKYKITVNDKEEKVIKFVLSSVGEQPMEAMMRRGPGSPAVAESAPDLGEVIIELLPAENRNISSTNLALEWKQLTGDIPDAKELEFKASLIKTGAALSFELASSNMDDLLSATEKLKNKLKEYDGLFNIKDSYEGRKKEIQFVARPEAEAIGIGSVLMGRQIRQGFYGEEAQKIQRGKDDIKVMVRYPLSDRKYSGDINNVYLRNPLKEEVPLSSLANIKYTQGYTTIKRTNGKRTITVSADADLSKANPREIKKELLTTYIPNLIKQIPTLSYQVKGEQKELVRTTEELFNKFIIALFLIYVLIALPFRSYFQPIIVMLAIPFGIVGAVIGHLIMGYNLSLLSLLGIVALAGVAVNDSLVLVVFINRKRKEGMPLLKAVTEAGVVRFRPIMLTSLTTFAGLTPLMLEKSTQAKFLIPMGVSLSYGVLFSTIVTLFIVPSIYVILEDILTLFRKKTVTSLPK